MLTLLYFKHFKQVLFSPQKCSAKILDELEEILDEKVLEKLSKYKDLVVKYLTSKQESEKENVNHQLLQDLQELKDIILDPKKDEKEKTN